MKLEDRLNSIEDWLRHPVKRRMLHKTSLNDVQGIVEVAYSKKSDMITAAYLIHKDEFDGLTYGRQGNAGILIMQSGFILPPYLSKYAYPERPEQIEDFRTTILNESQIFFNELNSLERVYDELTVSEPKFKEADPRGPALRAMFSAVVAFLLLRDWRPHMRRALDQWRFSRGWLDEVVARLEEAEVMRRQQASSS